MNMVLKKLNISENKLKRFKEKIKKDAELQMVIEYVKFEWLRKDMLDKIHYIHKYKKMLE